MKKNLLSNSSFIYGFKEGKKSFKLFKASDEEFLILKKSYFLGICYRKKVRLVNSLFEAEDYLIHNTSGFSHFNIPQNEDVQ